MMPEFMGPNGFYWFIGKVEDVNDPTQNGRIKIRCYGLHSENPIELPTEALPWAIHIKPVTGGSFYSPTGCTVGTLVFGFFADGPSAQYPIVMGILNVTNVRPGSDSSATHEQIINNQAGGNSIITGRPLPSPDSESGQLVTGVNTVQLLGNITETQYAALKAAIGRRESGNNYQAVNQFNFIGKYQFGNAALYDLGFTASASSSNSLLNNEGNWKGRMGITNKEKFLSNQANCQEVAMDELLRRNYNILYNNNVITNITPAKETAGYLAVAHLLGPTGATRYARGNNSGRDGNGVTGLTYYNLGYNSF